METKQKLQINYTDVWQTGRLLKMGVPAWSADCTQEKEAGGSVWHHKWIKHEWDEHYDAKDYQKFLDREKDTLPCWSVARLNEIFQICSDNHIEIYDLDLEGTQIERAMQAFENYAKYNWLDFSKLN